MPKRWNCSKQLQNASSCSRIVIQLFLRIILCCTTSLFVNQTKIIRIIVAWGHWNFPNEAQDICKRCNKVANCFFLIRSSVDGYKIIKTAYSLRVGDSGFSMSPRDVYYQFYKNAPTVSYIIIKYLQSVLRAIFNWSYLLNSYPFCNLLELKLILL